MADSKRTQTVLIRVTPEEKAGFNLATEIAGLTMSSWCRERLRYAAIRELEGAGRKIPFVPSVPLSGPDEA